MQDVPVPRERETEGHAEIRHEEGGDDGQNTV